MRCDNKLAQYMPRSDAPSQLISCIVRTA